jgi:hypothetical protein
MYLLAMATGIFGESFVRGSLIVRGDAERTAQNIAASETLFRTGIATDLVTFTAVIVLAWALYVLLRPVDRNLALLALLLRLAEVAVHYTATVFSLAALVLLGDADYLHTFDSRQLHTLARVALSVQGAGLNLGFVLLGLGSAVFAYLLTRSGYVPRALAVLGIVASLLLASSSLAYVVVPAIGPYRLATMVPMFFYEVGLGFWLLVKGATSPMKSRGQGRDQ